MVNVQEPRLGQFRLSPNPASSALNLSFAVLKAEIVNFSLINALGQCAQEFEVAEYGAGTHQVLLPLNSLPSGVYQLNIATKSSIDAIKCVILEK
jgi:Secretion system C-terminal sorting domain